MFVTSGGAKLDWIPLVRSANFCTGMELFFLQAKFRIGILQKLRPERITSPTWHWANPAAGPAASPPAAGGIAQRAVPATQRWAVACAACLAACADHSPVWCYWKMYHVRFSLDAFQCVKVHVRIQSVSIRSQIVQTHSVPYVAHNFKHASDPW